MGHTNSGCNQISTHPKRGIAWLADGDGQPSALPLPLLRCIALPLRLLCLSVGLSAAFLTVFRSTQTGNPRSSQCPSRKEEGTFLNPDAALLQGWTLWCAPGSVNMRQAGERNFFTSYSRNPERTIKSTPVDRDQEAKMNGFAWRNGHPPYGYQEELGNLNLQGVI